MMIRFFHIAIACLSLLLVLPGSVAALGDDYADKAQARLVFARWDDHGAAQVALEIKMAPGWHTYWRSAGEGGVPPEFSWAGSTNVDHDAIAVHWPWPQQFDDFGYQTYGYDDHIVLPVTVPVTDDTATINLTLRYAICADVCVPRSTTFSLTVNSQTTGGVDLAPWLAQVPIPTETVTAKADYHDGALIVTVPGAAGRALIVDNDDGVVLYRVALNTDGQAHFLVPPDDYKFLIAGKPLRIGVMNTETQQSFETVIPAPALTQAPR